LSHLDDHFAVVKRAHKNISDKAIFLQLLSFALKAILFNRLCHIHVKIKVKIQLRYLDKTS
jgi:hypothetical protein